MRQRIGLALVLTLASGLPALSPAEDAERPDTTGMGSAMSKMMEMSERMQASMPEAQLEKVEHQDGDAWARFELVPGEIKTGMGVGAVAKGMAGLGGPKSWFVVEGETAGLVLPGPRPRFHFAGEKLEVMKIQLFAFEVNEGNRRVQIDSGKQIKAFKKGIDLELAKLGDGMWELTPKKDLGPGQYGLANSMAGPVAEFGIGKPE